MPLMHCMECHHEWEGCQPECLCDWCGAGGYVLEQETSLERMVASLEKKKDIERALRGLTGEFIPPVFEQQPSFVETPADRSGKKK